MALEFQDQEDMTLTEWDMSGISSLTDQLKGKIGYGEGQWAPGKFAAGLLGGAWNKLNAPQGEEILEEEELLNNEDRIKQKLLSAPQGILSSVKGFWDNITDRGATVEDYLPNYQREAPAPDRFGRWRTNRQSTTNLPDYLKNPNYSPTASPNLMLQAWNNDSKRQVGSLTPTFNVQKWSE